MRIDERIATLFGPDAVDEIEALEGVVHVTAVWRRPDGQTQVLAINDDTPKSETDSFLLRLARARVDAIVATGKILRDEPDVRFSLDGPDRAELERWRGDRRGRTVPPTVAVLTSGKDLDFDHPALREGSMIYSGRAFVVPDRLRLVVLDDPSPRAVLAHLGRTGHRSVLVEAGPSTNLALYDAPLAVDELMLSELHADALPNHLCAGAFLDEKTLLANYARDGDHAERVEHGRRWTFSRFSARPRRSPLRRRPGAG